MIINFIKSISEILKLKLSRISLILVNTLMNFTIRHMIFTTIPHTQRHIYGEKKTDNLRLSNETKLFKHYLVIYVTTLFNITIKLPSGKLAS